MEFQIKAAAGELSEIFGFLYGEKYPPLGPPVWLPPKLKSKPNIEVSRRYLKSNNKKGIF